MGGRNTKTEVQGLTKQHLCCIDLTQGSVRNHEVRFAQAELNHRTMLSDSHHIDELEPLWNLGFFESRPLSFRETHVYIRSEI